METIRQGIRTDTEVGFLLTEGDKLVGDVSKCYELYRQANTRLSEFKQNGIRLLKEKLAEIEGEIAFDIRNDTTLKNADQRKVALNKKLKDDPRWKATMGPLRIAEQTESQINQEILICEHNIKIARFYFDVWQSRMAVIAGLSNEQQEHRHHLIAGANVTIGGNHAEETD